MICSFIMLYPLAFLSWLPSVYNIRRLESCAADGFRSKLPTGPFAKAPKTRLISPSFISNFVLIGDGEPSVLGLLCWFDL